MRLKKCLSVITAVILAFCMIAGTADYAYAADFKPGTYTVSVSTSGGSGRAALAPTGTLVIESDGYMEVTVSWIKTNGGSGATQFAWMRVNGVQYYPISGQTFQFPITAGMLDNWIVISALTEAMSQSHEVDYNMMISSAGIPVKQSAEPAPSDTQPQQPDTKSDDQSTQPADQPSQPDTKPADQPTQPDSKPADQPSQPDTKPTDQPTQPDSKPDVAPAPVTPTNPDSNANASDNSNTAPNSNASDNSNAAANRNNAGNNTSDKNDSNNAASGNTSNSANNAAGNENKASNTNNADNEKDQAGKKNNTVIYIAAAVIVVAAAAAIITTRARKKR